MMALTQQQQERVQRARMSGARITNIDGPDDHGRVVVEFGWGWLTLDPDGREAARRYRS